MTTKTEAQAEGEQELIREAHNIHQEGKCNGIRFCAFCEAEQRGFERGQKKERHKLLWCPSHTDEPLVYCDKCVPDVSTDNIKEAYKKGRAEGITWLSRDELRLLLVYSEEAIFQLRKLKEGTRIASRTDADRYRTIGKETAITEALTLQNKLQRDLKRQSPSQRGRKYEMSIL